MNKTIEGKAQNISTKNLGIQINNTWYNVDKNEPEETKEAIRKLLGQLNKGDDITLNVNEEGKIITIYKIGKVENPSTETTNIDKIIDDVGKIWTKCYNKILELTGEDNPELEWYMPSVNSMFIEVNKRLRNGS